MQIEPVFVGMRCKRRPTKKRKSKNGYPISASKSFYLGCERGGELAAGFTGFSFHFFLVIFFVGSIIEIRKSSALRSGVRDFLKFGNHIADVGERLLRLCASAARMASPK